MLATGVFLFLLGTQFGDSSVIKSDVKYEGPKKIKISEEIITSPVADIIMPPIGPNVLHQGSNYYFNPQIMMPAVPPVVEQIIERRLPCENITVIANPGMDVLVEKTPLEVVIPEVPMFIPEPPMIIEKVIVPEPVFVNIPAGPELPPMVIPELPLPNPPIQEIIIPVEPIPLAPELPPMVIPELPLPNPPIKEVIVPELFVPNPPIQEIIIPVEPLVPIPAAPELPPMVIPELPLPNPPIKEVIVPELFVPKIPSVVVNIPAAPELPPMVIPEFPIRSPPMEVQPIIIEPPTVPEVAFPVLFENIDVKINEIPPPPELPPLVFGDIPRPVMFEEKQVVLIPAAPAVLPPMPPMFVAEQPIIPNICAQNIILERVLPNIMLESTKRLELISIPATRKPPVVTVNVY